jgi:hypothetical protein
MTSNAVYQDRQYENKKEKKMKAASKMNKGVVFTAGVAVLVLLVATAGFAQKSGGPTSTATSPTNLPASYGPMRLHGIRPDGSIDSNNWSGYAVTGNGFTDVRGSWHVPEVNCNVTPNTQSGFWAGIDGFSDDTVEQTGTASNCIGTTPQYYAWYQFAPAGFVQLTSFPVVPGDVIGAEVKYLGGDTFQIRIHNHRTNQLYVHDQNVSGAERNSAEWIAEAPATGSSCSDILPLADFNVANYGVDYTTDTGTNTAIDSTTNGRISYFGDNAQQITMISCSGTTEAEPTSLTSDGTSFRVWWESE